MSNPVTVTVSESNAVAGASVTVTVTNAAVASGAGKTIVSSGGIADLTSVQQGEVGQGTIVVTTDGFRYVYSGAGSKTNSVSYVILADITPDWSSLSGKPSTFAPSAHAASHGSGGADAITVAIGQVTGLQTALDGKQASGSYAAASHGHEIADVSGLSTALDGKQATLATGTEGDVLTYASGQWTAAAPSGGGGGDYLPLAGGTMTGNIVFDSTGGQYIGKGTYDTARGGSYGLSLMCSVGYEINWQAGWISAYEQSGGTQRPVYFDGAAGTTVRVWDDVEDEGVEVTATGITFPDSSTQTTAFTPLSISGSDGDVLTFDSSTNTWGPEAPAAGLPSGMSTGEVLTWDSGTSAWSAQALTNQLPTSASTSDILSWNGSAWVAVMPSTPGLPSAATGQFLKYDGSNWVAAGSPVPNGSNAGDTLTWDSMTSAWTASANVIAIADYNAQVGYSTGNLVADSSRIWRALQTGMGNTPSDGSSYWAPLTAAPLPSGAISNGDVLTYNSTTSSWSAQAPAGGGPSEQYVVQPTDQTTTTAGVASSGMTLPLANSGHYIVEGVAVLAHSLETEQLLFSLRLSALDEDGVIYLDHEIIDGSTNAALRGGSLNLDQSMGTAVSDTAGFGQDYRIRFRAVAQISSQISSTNVTVWFGGSGEEDSYLRMGSWMSARLVSLTD